MIEVGIRGNLGQDRLQRYQVLGHGLLEEMPSRLAGIRGFHEQVLVELILEGQRPLFNIRNCVRLRNVGNGEIGIKDGSLRPQDTWQPRTWQGIGIGDVVDVIVGITIRGAVLPSGCTSEPESRLEKTGDYAIGHSR